MSYLKNCFTISVSIWFILFTGNLSGQAVNKQETGEHLIKNAEYRKIISEMLPKQKELAGGRSEILFSKLKENINMREKEALEFLYAFMPLSDLADYDGRYYLDHVKVTLKARDEMPWAKNIPEEIFLHFVLPGRVNNEVLDNFRTLMYDELKKRVSGLSMNDAALEINHWCHEKVTYRPSDARTSSALSTMKTSWGRCGEESVFTVNALRTIGIPSRQVYTPRWAHTDDNHAWVEIWVDGKWRFLGACEPDPDLDMGWFAEPARRAMVVHTRAYGKYLGSEPVIISNERFSELNLIDNYAPSKTFTVKVTGDDNNPVEKAKVEYRLYNYSEFFPLAKNFTNRNGLTRFTTGLGDLIIWVSKEDKYGYKKVSVGTFDTLTIKITGNHPANNSFDLDIVPPLLPEPKETSGISDKLNKIRLSLEDSIRREYNNTFKDSVWASDLAKKLNYNQDSLKNIFKKTYGNWNEIFKFIENNNEKYHAWLLSFLYSLSEKDIRDMDALTLEDHLRNSIIPEISALYPDNSVFINYVLSPRIGLEYIRPWRSFLQKEFGAEFTKSALPSPSSADGTFLEGKRSEGFDRSARNNINVIIEWIKNNIKIDSDANILSRSPLSPIGVYELKTADMYSRNIFFVALCRSFGIPSRLNPVNNIPQYYSEKKWNDALFEKTTESTGRKGFIRLTNSNKDLDPRYYINFTMGKLTNGTYETLEFEEEKKIDKFSEKTEMDAGKYMLVTGNRLRNGSVLSNVSFFEVKPNIISDINVKVRTIKTKPEVIGKIEKTVSKMQNFHNGESISLESLLKPKGGILIWLYPDKEPSKHVMNDLPALSEKFDQWGGNFLFLLSKDNLSPAFDPDIYKKLPLKRYFVFDLENKIFSQIEKIKKRKLANAYPVMIACDKKGNIIFYSEGYTIGIGDQLEKIIKFLK